MVAIELSEGRSLKLHIASCNTEVRRLCQEVLGEILGCGWTLHVASTMSVECVADLYLWDLDTESEFVPNITTERWRQFFLIDRANIQKIRDSLPEAHILLKPLTKATLTAFLDDACKRAAAQAPVCDAGALQALRQDRDEILQFLMQANLKLQEYDQDRTNFLARAIHDFRAPLTAITGYCGLLLSDEVGGIEQREVLERIYRSARKLSRMASGMFQLSVAPRAEIALDLRMADIQECVEHTLSDIVPIAEEKRISIDVDMPPRRSH